MIKEFDYEYPVTAAGKRKMEEEKSMLESRQPIVRKAIEEAREKGDLKENAEYHAAREELGLLQARIAELNGKLAQAEVVDESKINHDQVAFGATVELKDVDDGSVEDWELVGEGEDDALENKILTTSPMGQALIGHSIGDTITVEAPMGALTYEILAINYSADRTLTSTFQAGHMTGFFIFVPTLFDTAFLCDDGEILGPRNPALR